MATFKRTADILQALFVEGGSSDEDEPLDDAETDEDGWPAIQALSKANSCLEPHEIDSVLHQEEVPEQK